MSNNNGSQRAPSVASVGQVGLVVKDLDKMRDFYTRIIGLQAGACRPSRPPGNLEAILGAPDVQMETCILRAEDRPYALELIRYVEAPPTTVSERSPMQPGLSHITIGVPDLGRVASLMEQQGIGGVGRPSRSHGGPLMLYARDPEGNLLRLWEEESTQKQSIVFYDGLNNPSSLSHYRKFDQRQVDSYQIVDGHLEIAASVNQDLWGDNTTWPPKRGAPLLLIQAPAGYYAVEAWVKATNAATPGGPQALNTQVGLFVFRDVDNWLFFGFTNHDFTIDGTHTAFDGLIATVTYSGTSYVMHQYEIGDIDSAWLRLRKYGGAFQCHWRVHGNDPWIAFAETVMFPSAPNVGTEEVGMGVKTFELSGAGASNPGLGMFDDFLIYMWQ